jgi:hypothetical protein
MMSPDAIASLIVTKDGRYLRLSPVAARDRQPGKLMKRDEQVYNVTSSLMFIR